MSDNQTSKRRTKEENMEIIKQTTLELLEEKGYANVSTNEISEKSDINISLLYRYFPHGKPDIMKRIGQDSLDDLKQQEIEDLRKKNKETIVKQLVSGNIEIHKKRAKILEGFIIAYLSKQEIFEHEDLSLMTMKEETIEMYANLFSKLGYEGDDLLRKSRIIMHLIDSLVHRHVVFNKITESDEQLTEDLTDLIMEYLHWE